MAFERYHKDVHPIEDGLLFVCYDRWTTKFSIHFLASNAPNSGDDQEKKELLYSTYMLGLVKRASITISDQHYRLYAHWLLLWRARLSLCDDKQASQEATIPELLPRRRAKTIAMLVYASGLALARLGYVFYALNA